jgi:hypothetical protein
MDKGSQGSYSSEWQQYICDGIFQRVKYSGPIYASEEAAMATGHAARAFYLARLEREKVRLWRF